MLRCDNASNCNCYRYILEDARGPAKQDLSFRFETLLQSEEYFMTSNSKFCELCDLRDQFSLITLAK
ncbi:MAG TPA: hypothetical protein DCR17_08880 [Verrucomicrobiales bacterium]|nr:hypothetical protein [Pedosphaera sp.]HAO66782.1 hypothetical protein [Verrucomicrobiales bacterium]HAW00898.1 hypothetical protein [Verrucomicrobiales bacterium]HBP55933.1 hypothetical protein [Verrucomicrobiales bacterium]HCP39792.1 hypothetical protein [Verrucomicrobiales bacterium]